MDHSLQRVLLVDSNEADAQVVRDAFAGRNAGYHVTHVTSLAAARQALGASASPGYALIVVDWQLPDGRGVDLANDVQGRAPVIVLARNSTERHAVEAIKAGASEYSAKTHAALVGLPVIAENVMREWDARSSAQAEAMMRRAPADGLRAVADLAIVLADAPADSDVHQLTAAKVRALTGALAVSVSVYTPELGALVLKSLDARPGMATRVSQLLGVGLVGMRIPVTLDQCNWMLSLKSGRAQSLSELSWGAIPPTIGRVVENIFGLGEFNATVLQHEGQFVGTLVVYMPRNAAPLLPELMQAIGHMASVALRRKSAEERSRGSEARYRLLVENAPLGIMTVDTRGQIVDANPALLAIFGLPSVEAARQVNVLQEPSLVAAGVAANAERCLRTGDPLTADHPYTLRGVTLHLRYHARPLYTPDGALAGLQAIVEDMTQYHQIEERLLQAQKMEAVGRLAGGVAHDFNNMLAVILGNAEMGLEALPPDGAARAELREIHAAAQRSAELTQQLLAFARRQTVAPQVLDLNRVVSGMINMLRRLIGEDIDLAWRPGPELWPVKMDPSQVDQILANLAVNARDALAGGGQVTIATENVVVGAPECAGRDDQSPGDYVRIAFSDNGCGMSADTLQRLFEPFFTTKEVGKGTGLGLATVYGITKQNQGFIRVQSAPGEGATFWIYLPRHHAAAEAAAATSRAAPPPPRARGQEAILLVEDAAPILALNKRLLEGLGYTVLAAASPHEALRLADSYPVAIHLLVTDVVMPGMNGRELADALAARRPGVKRLFMSGYTADVIAPHGVLAPGTPFLQKPFGLAALAAHVRQALDAPGK